MTARQPHTTLTVGQLVHALLQLPADTPVTVRTPDGDWWLNITNVSDPRESDEPSAIISTCDDFDTRQW